MTKTTHLERKSDGVTYNPNIMKTYPKLDLHEAVGSMTDEGLYNMLDSFERTLVRTRETHADRPDFHQYIREAIALMKEELAHRTIGSKPHVAWEEGRQHKRTYYD